MEKKILFVTAFPPNKRTAGQSYTMQLLNDISAFNHVDLVYFEYPSHQLDVNANVNILKAFRVKQYSFISILFSFFLFPLFTKRFSFRCLAFLKARARDYDVVYFDFSQVFIYSLFLKHSQKVLMLHDVIIQKYTRSRSFLSRMLKPIIRNTEKLILRSANRHFCFSHKDKEIVRECYGLKITPVSFYIAEEAIDATPSDVEEFYFAFYGAWNRPENYEGLLWFVDSVLPKLSAEIKFKVIGGGMSEATQCMLQKYDNIQLLGFVDNPYAVICSAQALIAPLFSGAGVKVKVIESLAVGTPIIGTEIAFEGIEQIETNGKQALLQANTENEFLEIINSFEPFEVTIRRQMKSNFLQHYSTEKFSEILKTL